MATKKKEGIWKQVSSFLGGIHSKSEHTHEESKEKQEVVTLMVYHTHAGEGESLKFQIFFLGQSQSELGASCRVFGILI